ncbi:MAG: Txe/YoeB family addiction module toxin [Treponema sp.]|nr:Txe/YoeB family addiction module toxin [Treponema sp.]
MITFSETAFAQYRDWAKEDTKILEKINTLITEITRTPFKGTGKPEPLKGNWSGYWSRRITQEHRLIYKVFPDQILIASCKNHY